MGRIFTVSVIGCGSRGCDTYGTIMYGEKERFRITALCEKDRARLMRFGAAFGVGKENLFEDEQAFFAQKRSDVLVIATQDRDHVRMCIRALELGYHVLLEKPVSPVKEELDALLKAHERYGGQVVVCHVLRYAPAFVKVKELLETGRIGRLILIDALEQVAYWHQAHSFVRGNWRSAAETSPMIMQKCCHDLDLLQYYAGSAAESVYSAGELTFFTPANRPAGAAERCTDCGLRGQCPYSAEAIYLTRWEAAGCPQDAWPYNVAAAAPLTREKLLSACRNGPYGRCVFACDNNVVDRQIVSVRFINGVRATLTMTAFTAKGGRKYTFHGTHGEIRLDEEEGFVRVLPFGGREGTFAIADLVKAEKGHGGGDTRLVDTFYDVLAGNGDADTSLERSIESHLMALAAEESRVSGAVVRLHPNE